MQWNQFLGFIISMLAITNPLSSLAVFLAMTDKKTERERKQIALVVMLTIFLVLFVITWTGIPILTLFGISLPAFEITGGIVILIRGLIMLHAKETPTSQTAAEELEQGERESIAVVPLGIPIIAGPGAMTNVIIFSQNFPEFINKIYISVGVFITAFVVGIVLFYSTIISNMLGETAIKIMTRLMGLVLAAIAMSMITSGLRSIFPGWT
jgi:multiple antibiotic resistance protein